MAVDSLSTTFAALADPTRRAILARLAAGPATVKELSSPFAMSGPAVSKHLRVLERAGLIARGREAQWRPCMLGPGGWTMPVCEIDLRPGGAWHFVWRHSDGTEMEMRGVYREIVPPERIDSAESWGGDWPETLNTLTLSEEGGKTTVTNTVL